MWGWLSTYPDLNRAVREQADHHGAEVVLIEDKASGTQLIQEFSREGMYSVKPYKLEPGMNKEMRLNAQTGAIENGLVYLPATAEWLDAYLHEITIFPAAGTTTRWTQPLRPCTGSRRAVRRNPV